MTNESMTPEAAADSYPLRSTARLINDRLGLFLSEDQQRGLATGLLIGVTVGAALLAYSVGNAVKQRN